MKFALVILFFISNSIWAIDHNHTVFDNILKEFVVYERDQALFNYQALKRDSQKFEQYLTSLSQVKKNEFESWNKKDQLAFLINAYNAFTIKLIIDNYPVKSIKELGSFFSSAWKKEFIPLFGQKVHLDYIEHELIRKNYAEARIHFAVVCASIGCPNLQNFAYIGAQLDKQFDFAAKQFLASSKNELKLEKKELHLSKIFKWYGDDFKSKYQTYLHYISDFLATDLTIQAKIKQGNYNVEWKDYDWNLNEVK